MQRMYVPILVQVKDKKEVWQLDVTSLGLAELIELRERLKFIPYDKTIRVMDTFIRASADEIASFKKGNKSYIREYKKNRKEERQKIRTKSKDDVNERIRTWA